MIRKILKWIKQLKNKQVQNLELNLKFKIKIKTLFIIYLVAIH